MRGAAPTGGKSPYITPQGYLRLQQELNALWERRRDVARHLAAAAAEGDRSENAEYIYRKKELREIDRRIRYLQKRLPELKVVRETPADRERVFFGARVTLENGRGETVSYRIVGADEYDQDKNCISVDSPLAKALLKKKLDDEVRVETPKGRNLYLLVDIAYGDKARNGE
ncbi:MAG TPA: transcription elongation factor GreB [Gammaproteobacteria bacterium]|nr:transcription elongation factor GreB [Gammaproteobacteria bacterium]